MLKKEDKDGIIKFLKERVEMIRNEVNEFDDSEMHWSDVKRMENILDLCDKTLMEVTF